MSHPCCFSLGLHGAGLWCCPAFPGKWRKLSPSLPPSFSLFSFPFPSLSLILLLRSKVLGGGVLANIRVSAQIGVSWELSYWEAVGFMYSERLGLKEASDHQRAGAAASVRAGKGVVESRLWMEAAVGTSSRGDLPTAGLITGSIDQQGSRNQSHSHLPVLNPVSRT